MRNNGTNVLWLTAGKCSRNDHLVSPKNIELNDTPVSHTFAEQNKNHKFFSRQISTAILRAKRRTKLLRKEKHAAKQSSTSKKLVMVSEMEQMLTKVSGKKRKKTEKKPLDRDVHNEFTLSSTFDPIAFASGRQETQVETFLDVVPDRSHSCADKPTDKESDEGYNGSDEQDLFRSDSTRVNLERKDSSGMRGSFRQPPSDACGAHMTMESRTHSGRRNRKRGRLGAFHVELTIRDQTACNVSKESQKFLMQNLLQPIRLTNCCKFDRISSEAVASLARKRKVMKTKH